MFRFSALLIAGLLAGLPAQAQQDPGFFIPPGGARPPQGQTPPRPPATTPPRPPANTPPARPATDGPRPLPAGQQPPTAIIAIVDVPQVQSVSTAFGQVRDEIERRRTRLNDDLQREQQRWREEQQRLAAERATLTADQLRNRERELQDRITDQQRVFRDRQRGIETAAQTALNQIEQALGLVIRQVAASRNVNMILPRGVVIFNEAGFDLTEEVAIKLNESLARVAIAAEEGVAPANAPPARSAATPATPPAAPPRRN